MLRCDPLDETADRIRNSGGHLIFLHRIHPTPESVFHALAEAVEVTRRKKGLERELLRRSKELCVPVTFGLGCRFALGETEIDKDDRMLFRLNDDVLRLEIAMDHAEAMQEEQSVEQAFCDPAYCFGLDGADLLDHLFEGWTRDEGHDEGQGAIIEADHVPHRGEGEMPERAENPGFLDEDGIVGR